MSLDLVIELSANEIDTCSFEDNGQTYFANSKNAKDKQKDQYSKVINKKLKSLLSNGSKFHAYCSIKESSATTNGIYMECLHKPPVKTSLLYKKADHKLGAPLKLEWTLDCPTCISGSPYDKKSTVTGNSVTITSELSNVVNFGASTSGMSTQVSQVSQRGTIDELINFTSQKVNEELMKIKAFYVSKKFSLTQFFENAPRIGITVNSATIDAIEEYKSKLTHPQTTLTQNSNTTTQQQQQTLSDSDSEPEAPPPTPVSHIIPANPLSSGALNRAVDRPSQVPTTSSDTTPKGPRRQLSARALLNKSNQKKNLTKKKGGK